LCAGLSLFFNKTYQSILLEIWQPVIMEDLLLWIRSPIIYFVTKEMFVNYRVGLR